MPTQISLNNAVVDSPDLILAVQRRLGEGGSAVFAAYQPRARASQQQSCNEGKYELFHSDYNRDVAKTVRNPGPFGR